MNRALRIAAVVVMCLPLALLFSAHPAYAPIVDPCKSAVSVSGSAFIVLVCPKGDGDALSSVGATITLTVRDNAGVGVAGIPKTDMWLVGCNDGLLLCGGSQGSLADRATNALGQTTFSNEPNAGGCDTGLYVVAQGIVIQQSGSCVPYCLPIASRSPDYKSAGAPGPAPCSGDVRCPDGKVSMADYNWFITHLRRADSPAATYFACADYAQPFGQISLADYSKFVVHYAGTGHACPL
ncbi:MAG TPA: hypothetical protein VJS69_14700 [Candidatus Krumholzibacteria bacterium]|nr:hypothetical protein [Candidatus Krumholzibacteria bacterium]